MQQVLCLEKNNNNNNNINDKWAGLVSKIEKHLVCSCLLLSDALIDALAAYYVRLEKRNKNTASEWMWSISRRSVTAIDEQCDSTMFIV